MLVTCTVSAQEVARLPIVDVPPGTPGLGAGVRMGTIPYVGELQGSDLVPLYLYEGRYFFAHGTEAGLHLVHNKLIEFDWLARYRFQHLDPDENPALAGLDKRSQSVDSGLSLTVNGSWGSLEATWVGDTLNRYNGQEVDLAYRYSLDSGRWNVTPWIDIFWQDDNLTDYYYGVSASEVAIGRPEYHPSEAVNRGVGINTSYRVSRNWLAFANLGVFKVDKTIFESPIVDKDKISIAYVGAAYMFGNVFEPQDTPPERRGEWSWRINYGYQARGSIATDNIRGDLRETQDVDTRIAGLTLSKLVIGGPRVDMYARMAIYRHFESKYQDNFWSYAPYIMAMGKGYLPWRDKVAFRFGFGLGFSYADNIPIHEQVKQAERNSESAHFLNYLEWTVDFPIDSIVDTKPTRDCYVGLTDVHRSGVFATADILGNVNGGADWITVHVECLR